MDGDESKRDNRHEPSLGETQATTLEKEVSNRIDAGSIGPVQFRILILCMIFAMLDGYDLAAMGLAAPLMAHDWNIAAGMFGSAFSAALIGLAAGNLLLAWLGDRIGRKWLVIASALSVGLSSLGVLTAHDVTTVVIWRFLFGVAFGAGGPNIYALVADIMPSRHRIVCITLLTTATSIGGIAGGLVAPVLSERVGWEGIFIAGGIIPLAVALVMTFILVESPKVLAAQGKSRSLETVLSALGIRHTDLPEKQSARTIYRSWPIELVRGGFFLVSSLYAISWMLSGFIYYILANWLPSLLASSGWLTSDAQRTVTFLYSGGMAGGLLLSWIVDRLGHRGIFIVASAYVVGAFLFITAPHWLAMPSFYLFVAAFGITIGGAQYVLGALAARLYPPQLLATSLSWIGSVSRIGSVSGPLVGGWMMLSGWNTTQIMTALSIIPMLTAVTLVALAFAAIRRASASNGDQGPP